MDDQIHALKAYAQSLEEENKYLKSLLDKAGIDYSLPCIHAELSQEGIKTETLTQNHILFFYSMFKGRKDVYSLRSGRPNLKTGRHGYYPQCVNIWNPSLCGKSVDKKSRCSQCPNQKYKKLTPQVLLEHLKGSKEDCSDVVGLYPVWPDGTCNYLVFDFDDHDGGSESAKCQDEANALRKICTDNDVPCLVERSRSGKGAHVWIFFSDPIAVKKARTFGAALLDKGAESVDQPSFDTYDRMIPAQDKLPEGGLGNLVALPLQGQATRSGNSVFVDNDWIPYHDQWLALKNTDKLSEAFIDRKLSDWGDRYSLEGNRTEAEPNEQIAIAEIPWENKAIFDREDAGGRVNIVVADRVYVDKSVIGIRLQNKIRRLAAYNNPEYFKKQSIGLPTFGIPRIVYSGEDTERYIAVPRGCLEKLEDNLREASIKYDIEDKRNIGRRINVSFTGELYDEQREAVNNMIEFDIGILSAATGFGKTVVGSYLISRRKVNTLILVHTSEIMRNWITDLDRFLAIDEECPQYKTKTGKVKTRKSLIGKLAGAHNSLTGIVDVAMISSLGTKDAIKPLVKEYGMVIMDECHHGAAESMDAVLSEVNAKYVYGLTATVKRDDGKEKSVLMQFGPIRYRFTANDKNRIQGIQHVLEPRFTPLVSSKRKLTANEAYEIVVMSDLRNRLIASDIVNSVKDGHTPLVLSKRKAQLDSLYDMVKDSADHVLVLTGGKSRTERECMRKKLESIPADESLIILATGQYIGEGFNCSRLDTLFLAMPIAWDGNVEQYTGRLNRDYAGKEKVTVIDYVDHNIDIFANMYSKRLRVYKRIGYVLSQDAVSQPSDRFFYDSDSYYGAFRKDIVNATSEVVICSPYVSTAGIERLIQDSAPIINKGVPITLITYAASQYSESVRYIIERNHERLNYAGVNVVFQEQISSRYAVIDKEILWYGSMNLLSNVKEDDDEMRIVNHAMAESLLNDQEL
ncbi:MAG: DEAD/DEAH box helicase family protein [Saccharofermentans sp.]|nr:DEAD/DEAH box helicase family protein [Saccharofermentans sp.]